MEVRLQEVQEKQNNMKMKRKEHRKKETIDFHRIELLNEIVEDKKRKETIQKIMKSKSGNHNFYYLIKYIERGMKESLKILHIKNPNNKIIKIYNNREDTENELIEYNKIHFRRHVILIFTEIKYMND